MRDWEEEENKMEQKILWFIAGFFAAWISIIIVGLILGG